MNPLGSTPSWLQESISAAAILGRQNPQFLSLLSRVALIDEIPDESVHNLRLLAQSTQNGVRGAINTILEYEQYRQHVQNILNIVDELQNQGASPKDCKEALESYLGPITPEKAPAFAKVFDLLAKNPHKTQTWKASVFPLLVAYSLAKEFEASAQSYRNLREVFKQTFPNVGYRGSSERIPAQAPMPPLPSPPPLPQHPMGNLKMDNARQAEDDFTRGMEW